MIKTKTVIAVCIVGLVIVFGFVQFSGSGDDNDDGIPVETNSEYNYTSSVSTEDSSNLISGFNVDVDGDTYEITRSDRVSNSGTSLQVADVRVVGDTLVVRERFVDTTDGSTASPSVVSFDSYRKSWNLDVEINTVAVEHPYNEKPYIRDL